MTKLTQWHTLVVGLWAATGCGFAYTFSNFSVALEHKFQLSASDLDTIGIATIATGFITFSAGMVVDCLGPRVAVLLGGIVNAASWFVYGLIATGNLSVQAHVFAFTTLGVLATYGAACVTGAIFGTMVKNFQPDEGRSTAIGVAKAWVGLASGLTASVFVGFFPGEDGAPERLNYLFFLSAGVVLFVLVPLPYLHIPDSNRTDSDVLEVVNRRSDGLCLPRPYRFRYLILVTLALIATTILTVLFSNQTSHVAKFCLSVALMVIAALPWCMLLPSRAPCALNEAIAREGSLPERVENGATSCQPEGVSECGPREMLWRPSAWLLWFVIFALQAGGSVLLTNLGLITESRDGLHVSAISASALFSCTQSLGRLTAGALSDVAMRKRMARPWYFVLVIVCMTIGYGLLFIPGPVALYCGVALSGYAFGSQYPVLILVVAELFGRERIASNYMLFDGMPGAFASLLIAKILSSWIYQRQAGPGNESCVGDNCFTPLYGLVVFVQFIAIVAACLLSAQAMPIYNSMWNVAAAGIHSHTRIEVT